MMFIKKKEKERKRNKHHLTNSTMSDMGLAEQKHRKTNVKGMSINLLSDRFVVDDHISFWDAVCPNHLPLGVGELNWFLF